MRPQAWGDALGSHRVREGSDTSQTASAAQGFTEVLQQLPPGTGDCDQEMQPVECIPLRLVSYRFRGRALNQNFADAVPLPCDHGVCSPFVGHRLAWVW